MIVNKGTEKIKMSRTYYVNADGSYYDPYADDCDNDTQQTEDYDETKDPLEEMVRSSIELDKVIDKPKEQLKPKCDSRNPDLCVGDWCHNCDHLNKDHHPYCDLKVPCKCFSKKGENK